MHLKEKPVLNYTQVTVIVMMNRKKTGKIMNRNSMMIFEVIQ